jgi:hypothetical protein
MSEDRLIQALQYLVMLLFVTAGVLPLARSRYPWAKWARWGSIAIFAFAFLYAVVLSLLWALGRTD